MATVARPRIASSTMSWSLPLPTTVRGWTCERFWRTVPAMATPAERTSSSISSKCSSSGVMPTTRARSFSVSPAALVTRANSSSSARIVASTSKPS